MIIHKKWTANNPDTVMLLVHGMGAHSGRWNFLADFFVRNNISSYSIELKWFGETSGPKGHINSFKIYYKDILELLKIIKKDNPNKKVFLVGESMGGLIAFMMVILYPALFDGLICISPAFANGMKIGLLYTINMVLALIYNPKKQFTMPFNAQMCTRDVEYQKIMDLNPAEHRFASARLLINIVFEQIRLNILKNRIKMPILFLLAGHDMLVDPKMSKSIFKGLKLKDKTLIEYPEMYHALSIELGREKVFQDILGWIRGRL